MTDNEEKPAPWRVAVPMTVWRGSDRRIESPHVLVEGPTPKAAATLLLRMLAGLDSRPGTDDVLRPCSSSHAFPATSVETKKPVAGLVPCERVAEHGGQHEGVVTGDFAEAGKRVTW